MGTNLYFVSEGSASAMAEYRYDTEDELQKLIADNPGLLLRDSELDCARLMLVAREYEMQVSEDSSVCYYLDHLMVDQSGVPVLVEVKRSTDTRTKREVVAQMIDYASRVSLWDAGELRERFRESNAESGLLDEYDTDEFWEQVATCIKAERFRLVFAADRIPGTLKTMIEFLDRSMSDIEVYGVELRQYKTGNALLLSSSVIGNILAEQRKSASAGRRASRSWTLGECLEAIRERGLEDVVPIVEDLWNFAVNDLVLVCKFRQGKRPSFRAYLGDWSLFEVTTWWRKQEHVCTLDFFLPNHAHRLSGAGWDESKLRTMFTDIPGADAARDKGLLWETPKCVYFDLRLLTDLDISTSFRQMLVKLRDISADALNSHCNQRFDPPPPPPDFSTFYKLHKAGKKRTQGRLSLAFFYALHSIIFHQAL